MLRIQEPARRVGGRRRHTHAIDRVGRQYVSKKFRSSKSAGISIEASTKDHVSIRIPSGSFLFTQASIVSSVMTEPGTFFIVPQTSIYVNHNGDAWTNESLKANVMSFVGSYNFVNHDQEPSRSVGFIADVALRKMMLDKETNAWNYYADILVSTHRDYSDLVEKITDENIKYLSMGCDATISTCSKCGFEAYEVGDACQHHQDKGKYWIDGNGTKRIVAELLGTEEPGTVTFIEASWLTETPAFSGAAMRNLLEVNDDQDILVTMSKSAANKDAVQLFF